MERYAVIGRTFEPQIFRTETEAYRCANGLHPNVINYDGEVAVVKILEGGKMQVLCNYEPIDVDDGW